MVVVTTIKHPAMPCESCGETKMVRVQALMGNGGPAKFMILCEKCLHELADMMWEAFADASPEVEGDF